VSNWAIATLPLVGVIVGAVLQFWLGRAADLRRQTEVRRAEAYVDYLRSVVDAAHQRMPEDLGAALRAAADAKARIVVFGSTEVIKALAQFEDTGPVLNTPGSIEAFARVASAMRPRGEGVGLEEIKLVLVGTGHTAETPADAQRPRGPELTTRHR